MIIKPKLLKHQRKNWVPFQTPKPCRKKKSRTANNKWPIKEDNLQQARFQITPAHLSMLMCLVPVMNLYLNHLNIRSTRDCSIVSLRRSVRKVRRKNILNPNLRNLLTIRERRVRSVKMSLHPKIKTRTMSPISEVIGNKEWIKIKFANLIQFV